MMTGNIWGLISTNVQSLEKSTRQTRHEVMGVRCVRINTKHSQTLEIWTKIYWKLWNTFYWRHEGHITQPVHVPFCIRVSRAQAGIFPADGSRGGRGLIAYFDFQGDWSTPIFGYFSGQSERILRARKAPLPSLPMTTYASDAYLNLFRLGQSWLEIAQINPSHTCSL